MADSIIRVAMWSGPRNISTAMMRAWENRADTAVVDEPFYACYLSHTGIVHPMQEAVLASQPQEWQTVIDNNLSRPLDSGQTIQYQKHMTQHMVMDVDKAWFASLKHAFLIRHPADVVYSYGKKRGEVTAADIGFGRQRELFEQVQKLGLRPPVIDSKDVLKDPATKLQALCDALNISFSDSMLNWPKGRRASDGVWAEHWYQNVENSNGFAPFNEKTFQLNANQQAVVDECIDDYEALAEFKL